MKALFLILIAAGVSTILPATSVAQATTDSRAQVQAFLQSFSDATNRGDLNAYVGHYKESQDLVSISDGTILHGVIAIKDMVNGMLNSQSTYQVTIGSVDIKSLGPTYRLVTGPLLMTVKADAGEARFPGAMTMLLEKVKGKWRIAHDHYSYDAATATTTPN